MHHFMFSRRARMRILALMSIVALISGCVTLGDLVGESDPFFYLASAPQSSGCSKAECQRLDSLELNGYQLARGGKLTWVKFVDSFYAERSRLFPNVEESNSWREYRAYQRVLAEQMDAKKISESQWVYLLEKKKGELDARNQMLQNSRPRAQNCVTEKIGLPPFESYQTRCN
jgi:hypothetical protein